MDLKKDLLEAQVAVLGSMMLAPEIVGEVLQRVREEDFTVPEYRSVFRAIRSLFGDGAPIDPVQVRGKLGESYSNLLLQIMDVTPTAANWQAYLDVMREQSRLFRLRGLAEQLLEIQSMDEAGQLVASAGELMVDRPAVRVVGMEQAFAEFYERLHTKKEYLKFGLEPLDKVLYVDAGDLVILGGYASAGKTALALNFAWYISQTKRVGFFSMETSDKKLCDRLISYAMKIDFGKVKRREMDPSDFNSVAVGRAPFVSHTLDLIPAAGMTVQEIQAIAVSRRYEVIFIDYLQLIPGEGKSRVEEVSRVSIGLHQMAQRSGITTVALSQLSRPETRDTKTKAPSMNSLRESGQITQDADVIMLLYLEDPTKYWSTRILKVDKNKEGEKGMMFLKFEGRIQRFSEGFSSRPLTEEEKQSAQQKRAQGSFFDLPDNAGTPWDEGDAG